VLEFHAQKIIIVFEAHYKFGLHTPFHFLVCSR